MMGIGSSFLWFGWYINTMLVHLIVIIVMVIFLCAPIVESGPILPFTDPLILFITLFLFVSATIVYVFFISTLVERRK